MKILAIDPGYDRIGIAILSGDASKPTLIHSECFVTDRKHAHEIRLAKLALKIEGVIKEFEPDRLAIENLFFSVNQKTAIAVAQARGVIIAEAGKKNISVEEINPNSVKVAVTGYGASKKQNIIDMIKRLIKIEKTIKYDDEYDAIAIGITSLCNPLKKIK
jgi:crossover junction endodeoxyribonuclease RuvC